MFKIKLDHVTKIYTLFGLAVLSAVLHNAVYAFSGTEEPVFFILALIFVLAFTMAVIHEIILIIEKRAPANTWKLGFLGFFGLVGLIPSFGSGFLGFFGFFGLLSFFERKK
ncbi:MAG: hypothetical protein COV29_03375 [Candidatus Yanofskybacteria bacterium CG10_big_fil_rev_8_21_14_0_10_36_16]|uniref:Uncharacterized protein n=1 Tax=Candidatus Yanofskybacteria bacterium CG10_big_fil_rev_8_21_14_0_10_36_16 TaxID=1975096 RepID=A0A2J0Q716_9BACT|nr:MAG: hypothetical protein COV29_03375 [Candidatus Yanofskybacteria bacterium CG10_big_fil_rev_8_21_14_0_10_36_16]